MACEACESAAKVCEIDAEKWSASAATIRAEMSALASNNSALRADQSFSLAYAIRSACTHTDRLALADALAEAVETGTDRLMLSAVDAYRAAAKAKA
jgi:hypothetical protein